VLGDTLANTAFIYFDYNAPVQTNTTRTVVAELVSTFSPEAGMPRLDCFPNPAGDIVHVRLPEEVLNSEGRAWIWDVNGRLVQQISTKNSEGTLAIPLASWREGWYRVAWQCKKQLFWGTFLHVAP
ncbi:MAG: T9SS type A sorting domain-containing protein, partial [Saprospiraceae bacterium]